MKLITFNVNGVRAAIKKGLIDWLAAENPDVLCLQEIKLSETELVENLFVDLGYHCFWYPAQKRGYSGVATFTKQNPSFVQYGMNIAKYDEEGRTLITELNDVLLVNTYFPSGSSGDERQAFKINFLVDYSVFIQDLMNSGKRLIICGDVNICHKEIDIHNPTRNKNTSGFLIEEREWIDGFLSLGFCDVLREINPEPNNYTWWTYRAGAREKNLGWRIDYFFASNALADAIEDATILNQIYMSDHCPVSVSINF